MSPKDALLSGLGGLSFKDDHCSVSPRAGAWIHTPGSKSSGRRRYGMLALRTVCAVLMLLMQSCSAAQADPKTQEQTVPPHLTDVLETEPLTDGADATLKVFSKAKSTWTETEEEVRTGEDGKVIAESLTGARTWSEVEAEVDQWRPVDSALLERREKTLFSSMISMLAGTAEMQAPAVAKRLGLLSKASWTKSSSSSSSRSSSTTTKAPTTSTTSTTSSTVSSTSTARPTQTTQTSPETVSNSSQSNSSFTLDESVASLPAWDLPTVPESLLSTVGDHDLTLPANVTSPFSTSQWNTTAPAKPKTTSTGSTATTATAITTATTATTPNASTSAAATPALTTPISTTVSTISTPAVSTYGPLLTTVTMTTPSTSASAVTSVRREKTTATKAPTVTLKLTTTPPTTTPPTTTRATTTTPAPTTTAATTTTTATTTTAATTTTTTTTTTPIPTTTTLATTTTTTTPATTTTTTTTAPPTTTSTTTTTTTTTTTAPTTTTTAAPTTTTTAAPTTTTTAATTTTTTTTAATTTTTQAPTTTLVIQTTPPPTTTTEPPSSTSAEEIALPCNITEKYYVKTVLSLELRRNRLDLIVKQNLSKGLSHALQRALNDSSASAQVERDDCGPHNVTLVYYVTSGKTVYIASVVVEALNVYGFDKLLSEIRQHAPQVKAVLVPVAAMMPSPSIHLQLKTVLRFVGPTDHIYSCSFVQTLERRLENAFEEAQDKVLETYNRLTVEILSVQQDPGSPSVSLIYHVKNQDLILNGTIASGLLNQLTAELVGYFLFYPPFIIAEPLEYHNLNTSAATKSYWVITVIQDVDSSSLEANYQSFANLMEQRLAELFLVAGRQSSQATRSRRATNVGGYTVQMVSIRRLPGPKNPAELTYYAQHNGAPITGTSAAKTLSSLDSQTMALTLGYFVQVQAEPVVKMPPSDLWIMAVLTPLILLVVVIAMVTYIVCKRNRVMFKSGPFRSFKSRSKTSYRRESSYHHQPVQGFDYAKKHMGRTDDAASGTKETLVLGLPVRDAPLSMSLDKKVQDGTGSKRPPSTDIKGGRLPSEEDGSVSSNGSGKLNTGKSSSTRRTTSGSISKSGKEELHKRNDLYEDHSSSLRLITIKPLTAQPTYSYPTSSSHSQDSVLPNGDANHSGLKPKSEIEHYRNKLRQKPRRKGYGEFSLSETGSHGHGRRQFSCGGLKEPMTAEEKRASFAGCHKRYSHPREPTYWSRQSLSSPSPVETEMDLLVLRERSRRGIRNNGYDGEPEPFEETNMDRLMSSLGFAGGSSGTGSLGVRAHRGSDSSTLSSQPSIDEVRSQMRMLLGNAFSLAPPDHDPPSPPTNHLRHAHSAYNPSHAGHYSDGATSAPGTMNHPCGGRQRSVPYEDMHQCSLPKPGFRFTQLPDMGIGSPPPPLVPSRPPLGTSIRRSTPDMSLKPRVTEASDLQSQQHNGAPYLPLSRTPFPAVTVDQSISTYSGTATGNPITAVYAISANRPGCLDYFVMSPPSSYRSPSWMSYPPEPEDLPRQWSDAPQNSRHLETIC